MAGAKAAKRISKAADRAVREIVQELLVPVLQRKAELLRENSRALATISSRVQRQCQLMRRINEPFPPPVDSVAVEFETRSPAWRTNGWDLRNQKMTELKRRIEIGFNKMDDRLARLEDKLDVRERLAAVEGRVTALETRDEH
jgi:hypothetical protein